MNDKSRKSTSKKPSSRKLKPGRKLSKAQARDHAFKKFADTMRLLAKH